MITLVARAGLKSLDGIQLPGQPLPLALLLDLDGTLMDTFEMILAAMNAALEGTGIEPLRPEELRPLIGMPVQRQMALLRGREGPEVEAITDRYYDHFLALVRKGVKLYPGVKETLAVLAKRPIGTMTTRRKDGALLMLQVAGIDGFFTAVTGGDEAPRPKPFPDLPRLAAKNIGAPPERCVVVGDAPVDILAGRAARMWTIAATYGYGQAAALREAKPHAEIARFPDLPHVLEDLESRADPS